MVEVVPDKLVEVADKLVEMAEDNMVEVADKLVEVVPDKLVEVATFVDIFYNFVEVVVDIYY